MFHLPTTNHPARQLIDVAHIAQILNPANADKLLPIWKARNVALATLETSPAASRVSIVIVCADTDEKWLVSFGRKGGWRKEWNFGTGRA